MDLSALSEDLKMNLSILAQKSGTSLVELNRIFDIAYINYNDGLGDLTRNGEMVRQAIKKINANKSQYGCDKSYVIGLGMGGVVARIALNKMEIAGENHNVKKFIAINSPFQGINIPVGIQSFLQHVNLFIKHVESNVSKEIDYFSNLENITQLFNKQAFKQLLIYEYSGNAISSNYTHKFFMETDAVKFNPKKCESIVIASGKDFGSFYLPPFNQLMSLQDFETHIQLLKKLGYWAARATINADIDIKFLPNRKREAIYTGKLGFAIKSLVVTVTGVEISISTYSNSDLYPIDGTNGCYVSTDLLSNGDDFIKNMMVADKFTFIPSFSLLDIGDLNAYYNGNEVEIPFDKYYTTNESQSYGDFSGVVDILMQEVAPVITGDTRDVLGDVVLKADNFIDLPLVKYEWKFRNGKFKVVSQSGAEAVVRPLDYSGATDYVTVTATPLLDIHELSGLKVTFPEREITSEEIEIEGLESISRMGNTYSLSSLPENGAVDWSCSDGLSIEKTDGEAAIARVREFSSDPWIEATLRHGDTSYKFHKDLICARIDSIKMTEIGKKWSPNSKSYKYGFIINVYPQDIDLDLIDFCWTNTVKIYKKSDDSLVDDGHGSPGLTTNPGGLALIKTDGYSGACLNNIEWDGDGYDNPVDTILDDPRYPFILIRLEDGSIVKVLRGQGNESLPISPMATDDYEHTEIDGFQLYGKNTAEVTMPGVSSEEYASGDVICYITDDFGTKYMVSHKVSSSWRAAPPCSYSVSPNPAGDRLSVRAETAGGEAPQEPQEVTVLLYSETGLAARQTVDDIREGGSVDVSHLPEGTYYMNIEAGGTVVDRQVIVIRR